MAADDGPYFNVPFSTGIDLPPAVGIEQSLTSMSLTLKGQNSPAEEFALADQLVAGYALNHHFLV